MAGLLVLVGFLYCHCQIKECREYSGHTKCFNSHYLTNHGHLKPNSFPSFNLYQKKRFSLYPSNIWIKAFAHYNSKCKKCSYLPYTLQLLFTTATTFSTVFLYMGNNFQNNFFRKIFAVSCVVCKGLQVCIL